MLYYARSDTHYLLYIYDRVRNDLVEASDRSDPEKDLIGKALARSKDLSMSRKHQHLDFNEETGEGSRGWYDYVLNHSHLAFDAEQFTIFKAIWAWRDHTARKEDESPHFVLGNNYINEIAKAKPPDAKAVHSLLPYTAPIARGRVNEIWDRIQRDKARGGPSLLQFFSGLAPEALVGNKRHKAPAAVPESAPAVAVDRMGRSQLFGDMPISSKWEGSRQAEEETYVPFPWQKFVQDANADVTMEEETETAAPAPAPVAPKPAAEEDPDEEFTLRKGTKRKSDVLEREDSSSEDTSDDESEDEGEKVAASGVIDIDDDEPMGRRPGTARKAKPKKRKKDKQAAEEEKARRDEAKKARRARKLDKRAKRDEAATIGSTEQKKFEAVPFDYGQAASVVHAKRQPVDKNAKVGKGRGKGVFDPYSKTGDEPLKGARKAPPVRGERSATFRK